jgi:hypothetical protein
VGLVYDPRGLVGVTTARLGVAGLLQMVSVPILTCFMGAYRSVEKDTVVCGSGTWVRTHDTWVLWEEHGMWYVCC